MKGVFLVIQKNSDHKFFDGFRGSMICRIKHGKIWVGTDSIFARA